MEKIDKSGNFMSHDMWVIYKELRGKGTISDSYKPYYKRLVTTLAEKGVLDHHNEDNYSLSDDGHLTVLEWEDEFAFETDYIPINENAKIKSDNPLTVFLSCGVRDNEYPIADWLKDKLEENPNVEVYWWHKDPTNPSSHRPVTAKLFEEIEKCNFFIGILHRRYRLPTGEYTTSVACEDEFRWAYFHNIPIIGFRQKQIKLEGMILDNMEIRAIDNSDQIIEYLQKSIKKYKIPEHHL